jgi:tRNA(fMet)-specific endonuclease VapC
MYLLDANACIRILNNSSLNLVTQLHQHKPNEIFLCSVVKGELVYGAYHSAHPAENLRVLEKFFEPFVSLPFDDQSSLIYGRIRSDLVRNGTIIGPNDLLIASIAISNNLTLISANIREFGRVAGLSLANWEAAQ